MLIIVAILILLVFNDFTEIKKQYKLLTTRTGNELRLTIAWTIENVPSFWKFWYLLKFTRKNAYSLYAAKHSKILYGVVLYEVEKEINQVTVFDIIVTVKRDYSITRLLGSFIRDLTMYNPNCSFVIRQTRLTQEVSNILDNLQFIDNEGKSIESNLIDNNDGSTYRVFTIK